MDYAPIVAIVLGVLGSVLSVIGKLTSPRGPYDREIVSRPELPTKSYKPTPEGARESTTRPREKPERVSPSGRRVLLYFSAVVGLFAVLTVAKYWRLLIANEDTVYFAIGLFLTMVAGMFVQVLSSNYREGRPLFEVSTEQLIFPLLFALVVFYPIWALGASAPKTLFSFYAAFLNGFFWETVVSSAKLPDPR